MRYKKYLNESYVYLPDEINKINKMIQSNCKEYLSLIKGIDPLFRGMTNIAKVFGIKDVRQDRKNHGNLTTSQYNRFNDWLEKNGHNRRDNTVICSSDTDWVSTFGMPYMIFPMGNISYTWMESKDFNVENGESGWQYNAAGRFIDYNPEYHNMFSKDKKDTSLTFDTDYREHLRKPIKNYFHTDRGFKVGYRKEYEFWIKCKQYVYVRDDDTIVWDSKYQVIV